MRKNWAIPLCCLAAALTVIFGVLGCGTDHDSIDRDAGNESNGDIDSDTNSDAHSDSDSDSGIDTNRCIENSYRQCGIGGDVYWFDSCDVKGTVSEDCAAGDTCINTSDTTAACSIMSECSGGRLDPTTNLCWQDPAATSTMGWSSAGRYCNSLKLGEHTDWRLPTIDELRSLLQGCTWTETGGSCGVTDSCLEYTCLLLPCEDGCSYLGGTGTGGCYWDIALSSSCTGQFWSSSPETSIPSAWVVWFAKGNLVSHSKSTPLYVRCVRTGP